MAAKKETGRGPVEPSNESKTTGNGWHDKNGKFAKGNKGGGRKELPPEIKEMCRALTPQAIEIAKRIMLDDDQKASDRLRAVEIILDRGYGKPAQAIELPPDSVPQVVIVGNVPN